MGTTRKKLAWTDKELSLGYKGKGLDLGLDKEEPDHG
jgi:hypothetical protein